MPEIHQALRVRLVEMRERMVTKLSARYDEVLAAALTDSARIRGGGKDGAGDLDRGRGVA